MSDQEKSQDYIEQERLAWKKACEKVPEDFCLPHGWHCGSRCTICLDRAYQKALKEAGLK